MLDDLFRQHFLLRKETLRWLCDEVAEELRGMRSTAQLVKRQVLCALRLLAMGSFQGSEGSEETIGKTQHAVSKCVRRVAKAIVHAGTHNKFATQACGFWLSTLSDRGRITTHSSGERRGCVVGSSDSGYPLEPWLLTPVPGHPPAHIAEDR
ncbi:hypothetical protein HPB49_006047 [Dermacentor silvarum]|uniref:Uncharacterized protein n=1 Tax=Dermacentor silvarum TaxID=543639 RepID=A0ACB8DBA2_DERSI|nr:hypothetical protein HPB49_006047 [Dermacentor silvarum]